MGKLIYRMLLALLVLVLVAGTVIATVPLWADMEQVKQLAADAVQGATGKRLELGGDLAFSFFPWLGVAARDVSLTDPATDSVLATTERVRVKVRLLALLERRIEADTISLEDLELTFIRLADGSTNWDLPAGDGDGDAGGDGMLAFALAGLDVKNATVLLEDRGNGRRIQVREARLRTGVITPDEPVPVTLSGTATGLPRLDAAVFALTGRVRAGGAEARLELERLDLELRQTDAQGTPAMMRAETSGTVVWNAADNTVELRDQLLTTSGRAPALGFHRLDVSLGLPAAQIREGSKVAIEALVLKGKASYGSPPISGTFEIAGDLVADMEAGKAALTAARLSLREVTADGLRIAAARVDAEGDFRLDRAAQRADATLRSLAGEALTRGPAATTRFNAAPGTLTVDLATGEVTANTPRIELGTAVPGLGVRSADGLVAGPIVAGPTRVHVPEVQLDAVLAGSAESPAALAGTVSLNTAVSFMPDDGWLRLTGLNGTFDLAAPARHLAARGSLSSRAAVRLAGPAVELSGLTAEAVVETRAATSPLPLRIAGDLAADLGAQTVSADGITVAGLGIDAKLAVKGENIRDAAVWSGALVTNRFNPTTALAGLGIAVPPLTDPAVMKALRLRGAFSITPASARINTLDLQLDDSRITGELDTRFATTTRATFDLDIDRIDVDRYMPAPEDGRREDPSAVKAGAALVPLLPRTLVVEGPVTIGDLRLQDMHTTKVNAEVKLEGGVLEVAPLEADMYGGRVSQGIRLDTSGKLPRAAFTMDARRIDVGALLADLQGTARVTGTGAVAVELRSAGVNDVEMVAGLDGKGSLDLRNGAVKGINVAQLIRRAQAVVSGKALPADRSLETDFTELTGTFRIDNGVLKNDDLAGKSPLLRVRGSGTANLVTRRLDYRLDTSLVDTAEGQGGRGLDELSEITIPVTFGGTFADPTYSLDPGRLLAERAKQEVKRKLQKKLKQEAGDKLEDQLKNKLLEGLFGR